MTISDEAKTPLWGQHEQMRTAQIDAILHQTPIAFVPWGALEWHSYHNPIGLDGLKSQGSCRALAQAVGGIVLPPVYRGTDTIRPLKAFYHTLEYAVSTVTSVCSDLLTQLADEGFRVMIGHYSQGHLTALGAASDAFCVQYPHIGLRMVPDSTLLANRYPQDHAASTETSWQLTFDPALVDLSLSPLHRVATHDEAGVLGDDPCTASAAQGSAMIHIVLAQMVPHIHSLIREYQ